MSPLLRKDNRHEQGCVLLPGPGLARGRDGQGDRRGGAGGDGGVPGRQRGLGARPRPALLRGAARGARRHRGAAAGARCDEPRRARCAAGARDRAGRRRRPLGGRVRGARVRLGDVERRGDRARARARPRDGGGGAQASGLDGGDPRARGRGGREPLPQDPRASGPRTTTVPARSSSPARTAAVEELCAEAESLGARRAIKLRVSGRVPQPARRPRRRPAAAGDRPDRLPRADGAVHVDGDGQDRALPALRHAARRPAHGAGALHPVRDRADQGRRQHLRRGRARQRPLRAREADRPQRQGDLRHNLAGLDKVEEALETA